MRTFLPVPARVVDQTTGRPNAGSYKGGLAAVDLAPLAGGPLHRLAHRKRWVYTAFATEEIFVALAIVRLGYASSTFLYAFDGSSRRLLFSTSKVAPPFAAHVADTVREGPVACFSAPGASVRVDRPQGLRSYYVEASFQGFQLYARMATDSAPPPITAIAELPGGLVNSTEKRALLPVSGEVAIDGARFSLDRALGGYDYTNGLLERHTAWKWAFLLGRAEDGRKVAMNLVEGFVGESECALWVDDEVYPLAEGRIGFNAAEPMKPWSVRTADDAVSLTFSPGAMHREEVSAGPLLRTSFMQPSGSFSGRISAPSGGDLTLRNVLGVTEDQDSLW